VGISANPKEKEFAVDHNFCSNLWATSMKEKTVLVVVAIAFSLSTRPVETLPLRPPLPVASVVDLGRAAIPPPTSIPDHLGTTKIDSYSVFLVCNFKWLAPEENADLGQLFDKIKNFGRTIGDNHLVFWFVLSDTKSASNAKIAEIFDVERSIRFCKGWKLQPSAGPHLVVTSTYPDESRLSEGLPTNSAVFSLGNMSPNLISDLLTNLTDQLVLKGHVDLPAPSPEKKNAVRSDLSSATNLEAVWWVRLLEATQKKINNFGCAWTFKIDAGPVKADLHSPCQAK